jgi:hypothetical protein
MEMKSKYLHEQYLFEDQMNTLNQMHQQNAFMNGSGGGPAPTPSEPTYAISLQLTFNDTLTNMSTNYGFDVTSATAWNNTGRFTYNGSNSNFGTVEIVNSTTINLKGNEEGISIEVDTFSGDTYLTFIEDLNANCVTEVKEGAFAGAVLERAVLDHVTVLGLNAFGGCSSLTSVRFSTLTTIPNASDTPAGVFNNCALDGDNLGVMFPVLITVGDFAFYRTSIPSITSSTITTIGFRAFDQSALTSINLTSPVTFGNATGGRSFASCDGLISITLPSICTFFGNNNDTFNLVANGGTAVVNNANINDASILYIKNTLGWSVNP